MSPINSRSIPSSRRSLARGTTITALMLLATACGEDSDNSTDSAVTPTASTVRVASDREAYVTAGNRLCDQIATRVADALPDLEGPPTIEQTHEIAKQLEPVLQEWRDDVAALVPPADAAAGHQTLLDELDDSIAFTHAAATTEDGAEAAIEAGPPLDDPANAAHALFDECPAGDPAGDP